MRVRGVKVHSIMDSWNCSMRNRNLSVAEAGQATQ